MAPVSLAPAWKERVPVQRWQVTMVWCVVLAAGCGAGNADVDPADLGIRDLLGVSPRVAARWDGDQRAGAREVIDRARGAADPAPAPVSLWLGSGTTATDQVLDSLAALDEPRAAAGRDPALVVGVELDGDAVKIEQVDWMSPLAVADAGDGPVVRLVGWEHGVGDGWDQLPARGRAMLIELARQAGLPDGATSLVVSPAPRQPLLAALVREPAVLLVNPVLLAALDPADDGPDAMPAASLAARHGGAGGADRTAAIAYAGNPYNFYGSVNECAAYYRGGCERCLDGVGPCDPIGRDGGDPVAECQQLGADGGRGYYLLCANLALAIDTVGDCVAGLAPGCPRVGEASNQLSLLDANHVFIDDATCFMTLDSCLTEIFGPPNGSYPGPPPDAGPGDDGGPGIDASTEQPPPPQVNCDFGPSCDFGCDKNSGCDSGGGCNSCRGYSCTNDSGCACNDDGSCKQCDSDRQGAACNNDGSCKSCDSNNDNSSCNSDGSCKSCGNDSGGGGGCGNSSGSGGGCGNSGGGGGGSCGGGGATGDLPPGAGQCTVTTVRNRRAQGWFLGLLWALLPLGVLELRRRRERRGGRR